MADHYELINAPFDTVSSLQFSPLNPDHLLTSSWDTTVRLYDTASNEQKAKFEHRAAVLSSCFAPDGARAFSAGLDTSVHALDFQSEQMTHLGQHSDSVSSLVYSHTSNILISGSWDRTLRFWDSRSPGQETHSTTTPERVYHTAITPDGNTLVVAMAGRMFNIYDVRKMDVPAQQRESSLKYMTRSLATMSNGQGYATASVEGRIAVEYFDPSTAAQEKKYAFKCHRQTIDGVDHVWAVNALAFHPTYNTFASGGSDRTLSVWDHQLKKRLRQYTPKYDAPVSALAFNRDGSKLAIGTGYTWDEGEEGAKKDGGVKTRVWVRKVGDEVKPKGWTGS